MTELAGQPWLSDAATVAVLDALEAAGGPGCVRFVGGCVRNALMGQPVDDIDLSTTLKPDAVVAALKTAGLKSVPTGLAHGTVTAIARRQPFEITTLRQDVSTDGRNATVAFTDDWDQDAARRDFRLNALYADRSGRIFDPTGQGQADAAAGRIVFVGDPATRIQEDYLRILRFFRFHAWYGRGEPDADGLAACAALHEGMARLSAERVSKELLKLLAAPDPRDAVRAMSKTGVLGQILPEPVSLDRFEAMVVVSDEVALRLSALLPDTSEAVMKAAVALRLSNALRNRLIDAVSGTLAPSASAADIRAMLYRAGRQPVLDRLARTAADHPEACPGDISAIARDWPIPRLPIGGREVARAGVAAGPDTGRILKAFEDSWIADDFPADGHEDRLRALIAAG
ncbi:CCA tRNA nucleotidyltransferase [Brevundimonas variabilis]|uniref:Poly(A) polymerase n=1 Tax=Brevundimonas variabilis TaxID=74312 RepID=A0A7W9FEH2_9CAUL|nr:CCA tRNA nucleotidyltransferase [Brevundimonas variabilis]MBB5746456.1 poly(A) polymerase [Brevundimonas variabilis]